jgi:hypothetical protein
MFALANTVLFGSVTAAVRAMTTSQPKRAHHVTSTRQP